MFLEYINPFSLLTNRFSLKVRLIVNFFYFRRIIVFFKSETFGLILCLAIELFQSLGPSCQEIGI